MLLALAIAAAACPSDTTIEVNDCVAAEQAQADATLNRYYKAATARLTRDKQPDTLAKLRTAERAWVAYRDAECGAVFDNWKGGTIRTVMALTCGTQLTRQRTHAIWASWLTYADSTPPILPEPAKD